MSNCILFRFCELLLEFSAHEDNSDALLEALDPINAKPTFTEENFAQHQNIGLAASQLCAWVQGVTSLHSTLQTKVRPLLARAQSMKSSLADFSDKLMKEQGKVRILSRKDSRRRCVVTYIYECFYLGCSFRRETARVKCGAGECFC